MKFKGTIIAVLVIILLALVSKIGFKEDFKREETVVEPTERVTLEFVENTYFGKAIEEK